MEKTFALIDCNNFFASCERVFNPSLNHKPIVILSNNDGCVIARSNQAKALGIPMGAPFFKYKELIEKNNVQVFSSNYRLYGDLSNRIMLTIKTLAQKVEIYSVDEAFLDISNIPQAEVLAYAVYIREIILKWTGITVSIGIAQTKTLAKIANNIAKKHSKTGIYDIRSQDTQDRVLGKIDIEEIWGISRGWGAKLRLIGINTALDLRNCDAKLVRKSFGVTMEKTIMELRGTACLLLAKAENRKNIISTKSFGKAITKQEDIEEAISNYVSIACIKLRKQGSRAKGIYVFVETDDKFKNKTYGSRQYEDQYKDEEYRYETTQQFVLPSNDTSYIIEIAKQVLSKIYIPGKKYRKAGIMLLDCIDAAYEQQSFFSQADYSKGDHLMATLDRLNSINGSNSVFYAAQGTNRAWSMRSEKKSPCYTTSWDDLPIASM